MKIGQASELLRKHPNTLRNYLNRFADYFSTQPDKGEHRNLTDGDVRILAFIARLSDTGMDQAAIADALHQKVTAGSPFPPVSPPPPQSDAPALVPVTEMERRVAEAHAEVRQLEGRLEEMRNQHEFYRQREQEFMETINNLNREIGHLQARLEMHQGDSGN